MSLLVIQERRLTDPDGIQALQFSDQSGFVQSLSHTLTGEHRHNHADLLLNQRSCDLFSF